jgi:hypothetical protein
LCFHVIGFPCWYFILFVDIKLCWGQQQSFERLLQQKISHRIWSFLMQIHAPWLSACSVAHPWTFLLFANQKYFAYLSLVEGALSAVWEPS